MHEGDFNAKIKFKSGGRKAEGWLLICSRFFLPTRNTKKLRDVDPHGGQPKAQGRRILEYYYETHGKGSAVSVKMDQLLEVVSEVRKQFKQNESISVRKARIRACNLIANQKQVNASTVYDKVIRKLAPDVKSVAAFDVLLEDWLVNDDTALEIILSNHCSDVGDSQRVSEIFGGN